MKRILVTGAGGNASQSFIASLRMSGEPFYLVGTDTNPFHLEAADVEARYRLPRCNAPDYLAALRALLDREGIDLLHAQPDPEVAFLSAHRDALPVRLFLPSPGAIQTCHDKVQSNRVWHQAGVPVPLSFPVADGETLSQAVTRLLERGEQVWVRASRGAGSRAALPVCSERQAREWIHYWEVSKGLSPQDFMVCEYLPGAEFAFQGLWHRGRLVTSMARERVEYLFGNLMPSGQSSSPSIARTVHRDDVNDIATRAVQSIDPIPHGVYGVDLKENAAGVPCVTEINIGRFYTTSNFFSAAGCNMPWLYVQLAFDAVIPAMPAYNALEADLYWVRGVDRAPKLIRGNTWSQRQAA
jgi:carbamoyl-phosphate synthase large subunit